MDGTLLDVLGVLVAFVTIILLLSMIATGLVQATQALFRLRGRNLKRGIQAALQVARQNSAATAAIGARKVLDAPTLGTFRYSNALPNGGILSKIVGSSVSYVSTEQLKEALVESGEETDEKIIDEICNTFEKMEKPIQRRFNNRIRFVTIIWAVLTAGYFQISAPGLMRDLSTNPEMRDEYMSLTEKILSESSGAVDSALSYSNVANDALVLLVEQHEELTDLIEQASGIDKTEDELVAELALVMDGNAQRTEIVNEYKVLLTGLYNKQLDQSLALTRYAYGELAYINVEPWPFGKAFYRSDEGWQFGNLIGVLITAILLTMGAPFWYYLLKNLVGLRDALKPVKASATTNNQETDVA